MNQTLKNQFFQVFSITIIWVTLLLSLFTQSMEPNLLFLWRIIGIAVIAALLFGVLYTSLWSYFTLPATANIIISASLNLVGGLATVWLLSPEMFTRIFPWTLGMLVLSLIGHVLGFYVYAKRLNNRDVAHLNKLLK
ncbi:hypothetical protein I6N95_09345 [Vagococcus sp. BWB3-3]|uniref:Uncharacterized protein n=1 Tax=Vagococcus allomyrinae TaxID=2794353 RepID=A0A940P454_9ENTE|nr:hypothetical protein [Vagococcus allomyrinae]MBP1041209.1 hypothetical protein [Vagococcus allomyrinae]